MMKNYNAIYIFTDGSYKDSCGGMGIFIEFPDNVNIENIEYSIGKIKNIHVFELELEAIYSASMKMLDLLKDKFKKKEIGKSNYIYFNTDSFYSKECFITGKVEGQKKRKWKKDDGSYIEHKEIINKIHNNLKKIRKLSGKRVEVQYIPRKKNKKADKLANIGRKEFNEIKKESKKKKVKKSKRKYDGDEIKYKFLKKDKEIILRIYYKKEENYREWFIWGEIESKRYLGRKVKFICDAEFEKKIHRTHTYNFKIKEIFNGSITLQKYFTKKKIF